MNLRPRRVEDPEINMVSLIDVVLMMVVFFMLSSSLVDEGRIRIHLPQASSVPTSAPRSEPLVITVTQQGGYRVNEHELINSSPETLRAALLKEAGSARGMRVTIKDVLLGIGLLLGAAAFALGLGNARKLRELNRKLHDPEG